MSAGQEKDAAGRQDSSPSQRPAVAGVIESEEQRKIRRSREERVRKWKEAEKKNKAGGETRE